MFYPMLYAETHYKLKYLYPRYYKREPIVLFDIPSRVLLKRTNSTLPVFLLIKNANLYPATISDIIINVFFNKKKYTIQLENIIITHSKLEYFQFDITVAAISDRHPSVGNAFIRSASVSAISDRQINGETPSVQWRSEIADTDRHITVNISFKINNIPYINDNYFPASPHNFKVVLSKQDTIFPKGWHIGDAHYHSSYTSDQVEFGAPIEMTKSIAYSMGLDWFFVTDHSYDLDDKEDDFTSNDPNLPKWKKMKEECERLSDENVRILYGEEVSIKNNKGKNVHLLAINHPDFLPGNGDGFELNNEIPSLSTNGVSPFLQNDTPESNNSLLIAAHPFEPVPLLQKIFLKRGQWSLTDLKHVEYVQLINGKTIQENLIQIDKFFKLLLTGKKYKIIAGNDAHGNFQFMKQVKLPFVNLICKKEQIFGNYFTAFQSEKNNPLDGIKNGKSLISNGPFIDFDFNNVDSVNYQYIIQPQHGKIVKLQLIIGDVSCKKITKIQLNIKKKKKKLKIGNDLFVAMLLITNNGYVAVTNPVYV